ncbi:DUF4291 domain-containing protein [Deinococcus radiomollis]|uniref:DUF4291 domain-containing protein n=1 Tax=Deinococcus radiomollis TaxID=468916 RepID=UPI003891402A
MKLAVSPYLEQTRRWPGSGPHLLAQYDAETIVVYQAYRPAIGHYAAAHGRFGGEYSFGRMSWIKPNFLWMMFRSGWGTKPDQEVTLALRLKRNGFEELLATAVASSFGASGCGTREEWKAALECSDVRLQWDPDHDPAGRPLERRAIQLGLRGQTLRRLNDEWIVEIEDVSGFVAEQRQHLQDLEKLWTPTEHAFSTDC